MESMLNNLTHFIKNNPPLTIILMCILSLTITTYSLASYAENKSKLLDTDVLLDIYHLKKYINDLKVCIKPNNNPDQLLGVMKRDISNNGPMIITASVPIKNLRKIDSNITQVHGLINLEGFRWTCPTSEVPKYLEISFNTSIRSSVDNVCVQLCGPRRILENILTTPCQSNFHYQPTAGVLETKTHNSFGNFCENGTWVSFDFDPKENSEKFALFLPKEDQMRVHNGLLWCTYLLVVIFLLMIFIVIFYNDSMDKVDINI